MNRGAPQALFGDEQLPRLRAAAEELAWLTGRGYERGSALRFVSEHHKLESLHAVALERSVCSEAGYRTRAARELDPEDIARKPLAIDAADLLSTVIAALRGEPLLVGLDGSIRCLQEGKAEGRTDDEGNEIASAVARIKTTIARLRPSKVTLIFAKADPDSERYRALIEKEFGADKKKYVVDWVEDRARALLASSCVTTSDGLVLEAARSWFNLTREALLGLDGVCRVQLQA